MTFETHFLHCTHLELAYFLVQVYFARLLDVASTFVRGFDQNSPATPFDVSICTPRIDLLSRACVNWKALQCFFNICRHWFRRTGRSFSRRLSGLLWIGSDRCAGFLPLDQQSAVFLVFMEHTEGSSSEIRLFPKHIWPCCQFGGYPDEGEELRCRILGSGGGRGERRESAGLEDFAAIHSSTGLRL